jgi:hypothetical protein
MNNGMTFHIFSSPFGLVTLAGEIELDLPHLWWRSLEVLSYPPELQLPQAVLDWLEGAPWPGSYKHTLHNERYKLEGCYVHNRLLHVDCVTKLS